MYSYKAPLRDIQFVLYDLLNVEDLYASLPAYASVDRDLMESILNTSAQFAENEVAPLNQSGDEEGCRFEDGVVTTPKGFKDAYRQFMALGFIGLAASPEFGGQGLPHSLDIATGEMNATANWSWSMYYGLSQGAIKTIEAHGTPEQKASFLGKLVTGEWTGTMCLTEPQAGSSLSDIVTTAYPAGEGYYHLKGQKIFISGGDHDYVDNMVHLVLARIDGAPAGTRGISLFVAPKYRFDENGALVPNDVTTAGDFQKMGQRGYCTTHLIFGEGDDCRGWLVGKPHQGLPYMFQMMNGARIAVGRGGVAIATAAYYASLAYARERPQGRRLNRAGEKDLSKGQTLIINHPDVRRMLLLQKAVAEGALSLLVQTALYLDLEKVSEGEDREKYNLLVEILTPVVKTYPSEMGRIAVSNGLQILGGYGFCSEYILQQYYRDIRIMAIYEGTTGIQSLDLLGRKVTLHGGKALKLLAAEMQVTIAGAHSHDELKPYARQLGEKLQLTQQVLDHLLGFATQGDYERFLSDATVFMEFFSTIVIAWQWLKVAVHAKEALLTGQSGHTADFYESKIHTMRFFFKYEMPKTIGLAQTLLNEEVLTLAEKRELIL